MRFPHGRRPDRRQRLLLPFAVAPTPWGPAVGWPSRSGESITMQMSLFGAAAMAVSLLGTRPPARGSARVAHVTTWRVPDDSVVQFRLRDQFGRLHDAADYRGRLLYLVGAGREGRASATAWAAALGPMVAGADGRPSAAVVPVADLRGVPRLLRGLVRGRFPSAPGSAVLLDWDGAVSRRLGFDPSHSTVLVLGPTGRPVLRANVLGVDTAGAPAFLQRAQDAAAGATPPGVAPGARRESPR